MLDVVSEQDYDILIGLDILRAYGTRVDLQVSWAATSKTTELFQTRRLLFHKETQENIKRHKEFLSEKREFTYSLQTMSLLS